MTDVEIIPGSTYWRHSTQAGPGVKPWLASLFQRYIAGEHRCAPPEDGRVWTPIAGMHAGRSPNSIYICPECEACFGARDARA